MGNKGPWGLEWYRQRAKEQEQERWKTSKRGKKPAMSGKDSQAFRRRVATLLAEFRQNGCQAPGCAEKSHHCLAAHHRDPSKKSFGISRAIAEGRVSVERIKVELEKCVCLCYNCHAKWHAGELSLTTDDKIDRLIVELRNRQKAAG